MSFVGEILKQSSILEAGNNLILPLDHVSEALDFGVHEIELLAFCGTGFHQLFKAERWTFCGVYLLPGHETCEGSDIGFEPAQESAENGH